MRPVSLISKTGGESVENVRTNGPGENEGKTTTATTTTTMVMLTVCSFLLSMAEKLETVRSFKYL